MSWTGPTQEVGWRLDLPGGGGRTYKEVLPCGVGLVLPWVGQGEEQPTPTHWVELCGWDEMTQVIASTQHNLAPKDVPVVKKKSAKS